MVLSSKYNFSLGFVPAIVTILAETIITPAYAACMGAGIGLVFCLLSRKQIELLPLLLYGTTGMLLLLTLVLFVLPYPLPYERLPLLFEAALLLPSLYLLIRGSKWVTRIPSLTENEQHFLVQSAEAAVVSARILFILAIIHALSLLIAWLMGASSGSRTGFMLYQAAPPGVFIAAILLNQAGIFYFNKRLKRVAFVPVVNTCGEIIGKKPLLSTILRSDESAIYPIVRIAVTAYGMLYLLPRPMDCLNERGKTDLPMESFLIYGENVEQASRRIARQMFSKSSSRQLCYTFRYYYQDENSNRLVYLFLLELNNDNWLHNPRFKKGKLWTLQEIEQGIGMNYFSKFLELEFSHLKSIICTREKYKES